MWPRHAYGEAAADGGMMRWAYPERWMWMWAAAAVPAFLAWAFRRRARALQRLADASLLPQLAEQVAWRFRALKAGIVTLGVLCLVVALLGPQWGFRWQEVTQRGVDIVIALDVSKSMLAQDLKPSRLERAKLAIQELPPLLKGDRIGLVAFAGTSFVQCPLTSDYSAVLLTLDELDTESIPRGGTSIAGAIRESLKLFAASAAGSRALILITDGESHEGDTGAAAKEAARQGVKVFTVGVGTPEGELVPVADARGNHTFLKDREGRTVKSRLEEGPLQQIALETGGSYIRATPVSFGLDLLYRDRIAKLHQQDYESMMKKQYELRFQWLLAAALLLLACEPLISDRRRMAGG